MAARDRFAVLDEGAKIRAMGDRLQDLRPALTKIGAFMASKAQSSFRLQGRTTRWPLRMTPNIPGIVRDLNEGADPKSRRFSGGDALIDTGQLRQSITFQVSTNSVTIGSILPYAGVHQEGGKSTVTLTKLGQDTLKDFLKRNRQNQFLRENLGWLFSKTTFDVQVQQRKFLEVTPEDTEKINDILTGFVAEGE